MYIETKQQISVRKLKPEDIDQMYHTFIRSFEDYPVPLHMVKSDFVKKFIEKLNLNFRLSAGAFENNKLVGFIFTSLGNYNNLSTAYNGGTGVIPEYRGQGLTYKMHEFLLPRLRYNHIKQCILEVLVVNAGATYIYKKIGYNITRNFRCFKLDPLTFSSGHKNKNIDIQVIDKPDWETFTPWLSVAPSYLDTIEMINQNLKNEHIAQASIKGKCVGFIIFQPALGRISLLGVDPGHRMKGVGSALLRNCYHESKNKQLTLINVEKKANDVVNFFTNRGFENQLDQYEMQLKL